MTHGEHIEIGRNPPAEPFSFRHCGQTLHPAAVPGQDDAVDIVVDSEQGQECCTVQRCAHFAQPRSGVDRARATNTPGARSNLTLERLPTLAEPLTGIAVRLFML